MEILKIDRSGSTLATTLVCVSLALLLCLSLSSLSVSQLHLVAEDSSSKKASLAAESVLAVALEHLLAHPDDFEEPEDLNFSIEQNGALATIHFSPDSAEKPRSFSNFTGTVPIVGWKGSTLPSKSVQFVAVGESGGRERVIEAVVHVPEFPFALASEGPIESRGGLLIGGVNSVEEAFPAIDPETLEPADLVSNSSGLAITLSGTGSVEGAIKAVGQIEVGPQMSVHGEILSGSDSVNIRKVDLEEVKPQFSQVYQNEYSPNIDDSRHYNEPSLNIAGGLTLNDGILFVNGDLTIRGGLRGRGAILVNGSVEIEGGAALAASDQLALVAMEDVRVRGQDNESSFFQGLIYTEGDLYAENMTLLGAFVANRESQSTDPGSRIELENTRVVHLPSYSRFESGTMDLQFVGQVDQNGQTTTLTFYLRATDEERRELEALRAEFWELTDLPPDSQLEPSQLRLLNPNIFADVVAKLEELNVSEDVLYQTELIEGQPTEFTSTQSNPDLLAGLLLQQRRAITLRDGELEEGPEEIHRFLFDLNEFLQPASRMRIISWRQH